MRIQRPLAIFIGVVLAGVCLLAGFVLATGGLLAWGLNPRRAAAPQPTPPTPILATPVQPALVTPTRAPQVSPTPALTATLSLTATLTISPSLALTFTPAVGIDALTPSLSPELFNATQTSGPLSAGPAITPTLAATFPPVAQDPNCIPFNRPSTRARVLAVLDGATIEVDAGGKNYRVRYIGVAIPDPAADPDAWQRAKEYNQRLVEGETVLLIQDLTERDAVSYRPRYVLAGGVFVNLEMIASGRATAAARPPDLSCQALFDEAQQRATLAQAGLWAPQPTATRILFVPPTATVAVTGPLRITLVAERGNLWQEPEEWVEIRNDSQETIQLEGWTIQDNERHIFTFPKFSLGSGQYCRVYTNEYHPNSCGFSYWSPSPIWDNETDCAYLKDPYGTLISTFCYGFQ